MYQNESDFPKKYQIQNDGHDVRKLSKSKKLFFVETIVFWIDFSYRLSIEKEIKKVDYKKTNATKCMHYHQCKIIQQIGEILKK